MSGNRRGPRRALGACVALVAASCLVAAPAGAAGEPPPSVPAAPPAPPTTVRPPPPPAFGMRMDAGPHYTNMLATAKADVTALEPVVAERQARSDRLHGEWERLERRLGAMTDAARRAAAELESAHDRVQQLAVRAYVYGGSSRLGQTVETLLASDGLVDAGRNMKIMDSFGEEQGRAVEDYREQKARAERQVRELTDARADLEPRVTRADRELAEASAALADAHARIEEAEDAIAHFHEIAGESTSPIMGPNRLTADDLAAFVRASGHEPNVTVPIEELAQLYLEESEAEGIRGDVAFAQSILETGWFVLPERGLVTRHDNNFAGIGACDSCDRGLVFPDARIGVRAQIQALRIYVDPDYRSENSAHPIIRPKMLRLGFRGKVQSWWDLWGTWATGELYGVRVYSIYLDMVRFAEKRHAEEAAVATPPAAPAPGA